MALNETVDININASQAITALQNIDRNVNELTQGFRSFAQGVAEGMTKASQAAAGMRTSTDRLKTSSERLAEQTRNTTASNDLFTTSLARLGTVIAGLGLGALINSTRLYAQQVQSASNATGLTTTAVQQFAASVARSGGQVENAVESIIEFTEKINEAREGSDEMRRTFAMAGVSLQELYSGDTQAIFQKTLKGLNSIGDSTIRNTTAARLLGEQFKKIDIRTVAGGTGTGAVASSTSIRAAADAQANLNVQLQNLRVAIIESFQPLNTLIARINVTVEQFKKLLDILLIVGSFFLGGLIARGIVFIAQGLRSIVVVVESLIARFGALSAKTKVFNTLDNSIKFVERATRALGSRFKELGTRITTSGQSVKYITGPLAVLYNYATKAADAIGRFLSRIQNNVTIATFSGIILATVVAFRDFIKNVITGEGALTDFERVLHVSMIMPLKTIGSVFDFLIDKAKRFFSIFPNIDLSAIKDFFTLRSGGEDAASRAGWSEQTRAMEEYARSQEDAAKAALERADQMARAQANIVAAVRQQRYETDQSIKAYQLSNKLNRDALQLQLQQVGKTEDEIQLQQSLNQIQLERANQLRAIAKQYDDLQQAARIANKETEAGRQALALFNDFAARRKKLEQEINYEYDWQTSEVRDLVHQIQAAQTIERDRLANLEQITAAYERQRNLAQTLASVNQTVVQRQQDLAFERSLMGKGGFERELLTARRALNQLYAEQSQAIAEAFSIDGEIVDVQGYAAAIARLAEQFRQLSATTDGNAAAARRWSTGWNEAVENFADDAYNAADRARTMFNSIISSMESTLDNFVRTGKLNFKDLVRSIIADLTSMALKNAFRQLLLASSAGKGGTLLSTLGSFFAGFFANGGFIPPGKAGIVGEAGPELVSGPAQVTPMSAMPAGPSIVNNYYISALDAKSVAQLFSENRRTLLGVTEQARKEMPIRQRF